MKKIIYVIILSLFVCVSCNKDELIQEDQTIDNFARNSPGKGKINLCHYDAETDTWKIINPSNKSLDAHLNHGDVLLVDSDGDGYVTEANECLPVDCDDTDDQLTDNCIPSVTICDQVWMLKNLDVTKYRNGDDIPQVQDPTFWASLTTGAWCYYQNNSENGTTYGKLYNWYAVNDPRGLAPVGWHVPTNDEWLIMADCLGGVSVAGGKLKEAGLTHWNSPNTDATNETGFTALPSGHRWSDGGFYEIGYTGHWWSASISQDESTPNHSQVRYVRNNDAYFYWSEYPRINGYGIRCVKD